MRATIEWLFLLKPSAMKSIITLALIFLIVYSCKENTTDKVKIDTSVPNVELSTAEIIANTYGIDNWSTVTELNFTFNVDVGERHIERSFVWNPKTQDVVLMNATDTISYNRNAPMDSLQVQADKRFINDSYWLLSPFKLVWDEGVSFSEEENVIAPISKDTLHRLTILYEGEGGYTPGDAYDFYYSDDYMIREWGYRGDNAEKASTSTSWVKLETFNGLKLNTVHQDSLGNFKLYFTNISVK